MNTEVGGKKTEDKKEEKKEGEDGENKDDKKELSTSSSAADVEAWLKKNSIPTDKLKDTSGEKLLKMEQKDIENLLGKETGEKLWKLLETIKGGDEKKEGEKKGSNKDANGKCVGADTCAGEGAAANLSSPAKMLDNAKEQFDAGVRNSLKTIATTITNPAKCATMAVGAVPAMINGIGKSISGAFDGITLSINNSIKAADAKGFTGILGPFKIANAMFLGKLQGVFNNIALGPDADVILSNPKITGKILFDKLVSRSKMYKLAIEDAEFRGVLKPWITEYVNNLLSALKVAQPEIDRINSEIKKIIEGMGSNIGESLGHAITNVIVSAISAVPLVGWVAPLVKSADELGQSIINTCKPPIAKGAGIVMPVVNGFNKQKSRLECEVEKLENKVKPIMKKIEGKMNSGTTKGGGSMQGGGMQSGGGRHTKRRISKKIGNTTKRINELLNRFTARRHLKPNYTRRLNQSRC